MSPRFWELLGYDPTEKKHLASEWQDIINQEDLKLSIENFQRHCDNPKHLYDQVVRYRHKNGSTVWVRCRGVGIRDSSGNVVRMMGAHTDVTHIKRIEAKLLEVNQRLEDINQKDPMTGLLNRNGLIKKFEEYVSVSIRHNLPLGLAFIDVDNFKNINDHCGHLTGDEFLITLAKCLRKNQRSTDVSVRIGGDEFVVIMLGANLDQAAMGAERIRKDVELLFNESLSITVSIGIVSLDSYTIQVSQKGKGDALCLLRKMLKAADSAMYSAKDAGKNTVYKASDIDATSSD